MNERIKELFDQLNDEVLDLRIAIAQERDNHLNEGELVATLEVYGEFGR